MIKILESKTADTRTCNVEEVDKITLINSTHQHISDVRQGLLFFIEMMKEAGMKHDHDKLSNIDEFYGDFQTNFERTVWWENHKKVNRHHLFTQDGVPDDVNLVDVIELIVDCVMAGMARTGHVYELNLNPEVLQRAFKNTVGLNKGEVVVEK